jgi:hypothetical protein
MIRAPLTAAELEQLLTGRSISLQPPWCTNDESLVDSYYRAVCEATEQATGASSRIEWNHYGSGYASFIDAWFYKTTDDFAIPDAVRFGEGHVGLAVLFCRLSPHFVFMEGMKHWHFSGSSSYLPAYDAVDSMQSPGVTALAQQIQPLLERHGLRRFLRGDLASLLPAETQVYTNLGDAPYTEFDTFFHWED